MSAEQFKQFWVNSLSSKIPAIGGVDSSGILGELLDKVAEQNDTLTRKQLLLDWLAAYKR